MNIKQLQEQRGVAMLLELILIAAVLSLVGLAVYQSSHRGSPVAGAVKSVAPASPTAAGLAAEAAKTVEQDSSDEVTLSADAEGSADELDAADTDTSNLEGSFNENSF
jgi:pyruvoyl-dependent arginine decarboxylase (PvlArgDC)